MWHLLFSLSGAGAAALLGMAWGRDRERRTLLSPVVLGRGERRVGDYESQLRRDLGLARIHPDAAHAPVLRRARVLR